VSARDSLKARRARDIWRRHLRSYLPRPIPAGRHVRVVRLTPTGNLLALVPPRRGGSGVAV